MLTIDHLRLQLPPRHAARAARIGRLLGEELAALGWTTGRIEAVSVSALRRPAGGSDRQVARYIARAIRGRVNAQGGRRDAE